MIFKNERTPFLNASNALLTAELRAFMGRRYLPSNRSAHCLRISFNESEIHFVFPTPWEYVIVYKGKRKKGWEVVSL